MRIAALRRVATGCGLGIALLAMVAGVIAPAAHAQGAGKANEIPGVRRLGVDQAAGVPRVRLIPSHPFGSGSYGNLPVPQRELRPNMRFANGSLDPNMRNVVGLNALALPSQQGSDHTVISAIGSAVANGPDIFDTVIRRPVPDPVASRPSAPVCSDDQMTAELQAGGTFWNGQARSTVPTAFPLDVYTQNAHGNVDPLRLGQTGHPVNVPREGPAGGWCRPPPTPMSESSPLERRAFWILVLFPTMVITVFWLSRGFRIDAVYDEPELSLSSNWKRQNDGKVPKFATFR